MDDKLKFIDELLDICQLPELTHDLDSVPIEAKDFAKFHEIQATNLPVLYDFLQFNEHWICAPEDAETREIYAKLVMLLCELTAHDAIYKLPNDHTFLKHAEDMLKKHKNLTEEIVNMVFKNYQRKLQKHVWKRQMGAVHGFLQFFKHLFYDGDHKMSVQHMNFSLAVALNVRECHDTSYKHMGIEIFQIILSNSQTLDIQMYNINGVIYDDVIKDVHYMDSVEGTDAIWQCLMQCLQNNKQINTIHWCCIDDLIEILLRDIPLAPNADISHCMLKYVTKLGYFFPSSNMKISKEFEKLDLCHASNLLQLGNICRENNSHIIYRWTKSLLNLFVIEAYKLKQNAQTCKYLLEETIRCFCVYIWPIPLRVLEPHLCVFYEKYILLLMEVIATHEKNKSVIELVKSFVTLCLQKISSEFESSMLTYREALQELEIVLEKRKSFLFA